MTAPLSPEERAIAERVAALASPAFALSWLGQMRRLEEQVADPAKRWHLLREAMALVGRGKP